MIIGTSTKSSVEKSNECNSNKLEITALNDLSEYVGSYKSNDDLATITINNDGTFKLIVTVNNESRTYMGEVVKNDTYLVLVELYNAFDESTP